MSARAVEESGPQALSGLCQSFPSLHRAQGPGSMHWLASGSPRAPAGDIGVSATDMETSIRGVRTLVHRLDAFTPRDLFLGQFVMLGREQRRQGGALL